MLPRTRKVADVGGLNLCQQGPIVVISRSAGCHEIREVEWPIGEKAVLRGPNRAFGGAPRNPLGATRTLLSDRHRRGYRLEPPNSPKSATMAAGTATKRLNTKTSVERLVKGSLDR